MTYLTTKSWMYFHVLYSKIYSNNSSNNRKYCRVNFLIIMDKGWIKTKEELGLHQKDGDGYWYTDEPIFCNFTNKQINNGYMIATENEFIGICDISYFFKELRHKLFSKHEFIYLSGIISSSGPVKKTRKRERNKMTDSLRYKILKRDKFKCKSCGAKAGDVELEIDHIVPVSKGGKTTEINLQTLCKKCNRGKSNEN